MSNQTRIFSSIGIVLLIIGLVLFFKENPSNNTQPNQTNQTNQTNMNETSSSITELKKEIITEGTGEAAKQGDTVTVHYTGTLTDGTKFDSSLDRGQPFSFTLGAGQVIQGWDEGVNGMKVGEKAKLSIPYSMGYGDMGYPPVIPQKADLIFEIELLKIN